MAASEKIGLHERFDNISGHYFSSLLESETLDLEYVANNEQKYKLPLIVELIPKSHNQQPILVLIIKRNRVSEYGIAKVCKMDKRRNIKDVIGSSIQIPRESKVIAVQEGGVYTVLAGINMDVIRMVHESRIGRNRRYLCTSPITVFRLFTQKNKSATKTDVARIIRQWVKLKTPFIFTIIEFGRCKFTPEKQERDDGDYDIILGLRFLKNRSIETMLMEIVESKSNTVQRFYYPINEKQHSSARVPFHPITRLLIRRRIEIELNELL
ncbi:hypothetical protein ACOME3_008072 [Neoechinorhynchus agilis]